MSVNIFIAGDFHIPSRASMLDPKFQDILENRSWDYIVLTGDLTIVDVLKRFEKHVQTPKHLIACKGNMDQINLPLSPVFSVGSIKIGVFHGTEIYPRGDISQLKRVAKKLGVKILITGHSHQTFIHSDKEHVILNPGTATGASGGSSWNVDTAIIILKINSETNELSYEWYKIENNRCLKLEQKIS